MDPAEEAAIQQMLMSMLTNRQAEPVQETSPLQAARGKKAADMMSSSFWGGEPMYYTPASAFDFTDENVHRAQLQRLARDAQHAAEQRDPYQKLQDQIYREEWEKQKYEERGHPDWALPPNTPPWWPTPTR